MRIFRPQPWIITLALAVLLLGCAPQAAPSPAASTDSTPATAAAKVESASATAVATAESPAEAPASGRGADDTLRLIWWQAPTILNPHLSTGGKDFDASRIAYEPLASFNSNGELIPFLAAEAPSLENGGVAADGLSVTWKLKPEVVWSDGEPFTADDVKFTYDYLRICKRITPQNGVVRY